MKKIILSIFLALSLAGCVRTQKVLVTEDKHHVEIPNDEYFREQACPSKITVTPLDPNHMTQRDAASALAQLSQNNTKCRATVDRIHQLLLDLKKVWEDPAKNQDLWNKIKDKFTRQPAPAAPPSSPAK